MVFRNMKKIIDNTKNEQTFHTIYKAQIGQFEKTIQSETKRNKTEHDVFTQWNYKIGLIGNQCNHNSL